MIVSRHLICFLWHGILLSIYIVKRLHFNVKWGPWRNWQRMRLQILRLPVRVGSASLPFLLFFFCGYLYPPSETSEISYQPISWHFFWACRFCLTVRASASPSQRRRALAVAVGTVADCLKSSRPTRLTRPESSSLQSPPSTCSFVGCPHRPGM